MGKNKFEVMEYIRVAFDKYKYILLICVVGILLTMLPSKGTKPVAAENTPQEGDYLADVQILQKSLQELLQNIEGVGRAEIMLTAKHGREPAYIYNETKSESGAASQKRELVIVRNSSGEQPVISSIGAPQYMGAVIVCDGAKSATVQLEITQAIMSLTGITSDDIKISQMIK